MPQVQLKIKTKKFDSLQIFRGLAALSVVVFHAANSIDYFIGKIPDGWFSIFKHGFLGVDFFFVLSGYIIMSNHFDDKKSIAALKIYITKRAFRIFPIYWVVSIALLASYTLLPGLSAGPREDFSLLSSLLLLPGATPPALNVAWTLIHELMFYMVFVCFFISNRLFIIFVSGWMLAIAADTWLFGFSPQVDGFIPQIYNDTTHAFLAYFLNPLNLEFMLGMGTAYLARRVANNHVSTWIFFGGFLIFGLLLLWPFAQCCRMVFGLPFAALVLGAVWLERQNKLFLPHWLIILGDASYSIYLIHNPLVSLTSRLVKHLGFTSWEFGILIDVIASVIVGVLFHLFVEKPLMRLFRTSRRDRANIIL